MKITGPKNTESPAIAGDVAVAPLKPTTTARPLEAPSPPRETGRPRSVPADLPPAGLSHLAGPALGTVGQELTALAGTVGDAALHGVLSRAATAAADVSRMASVATPLRLSLKRDDSRPAEIEAFVDRRIAGPATAGQATAQLSPTNRDLRPFPVAPGAIEGLRNGARVKLVLERTDGDAQIYRVKADESAYAGSVSGTVVLVGGQPFVDSNPLSPVYGRIPLPGGEALVGQTVVVDVSDPADAALRSATVRKVVGEAGGLSARLLDAAIREGVSVGHSAAAMAEVSALQANPPIHGKDLTHLPFITIDNVGSKDLDQAMCIERRADGGYDVHYAIADVAHFVKKDSALDREARRRTQTVYLADGQNVPMLPRELSEGLISLLPNQKRRAFVVTVSLDANGEVKSRSFQRGVVESKKQMAYTQVQSFVDGGMKGDLAGQPWSKNLTLLRELGQKRVAMSDARGVVPSDDGRVHLGVSNGKLVTKTESRNQVEKWNEQISLLANEAVGAELRSRGVKALFRTHPTPPPEKVEAFREMVAVLGKPWPEGQGLADYVRGLDPHHPMTAIIQGLSSSVNVPATYATKYAGGHSGLKLDDYVHFTAPMRRYTDVIVARILGALVEGDGDLKKVPYQKAGDRTLDQVVHLADEARRREGNLSGREGTMLTAAWFADKMNTLMDARVVGVRPSGVRVALAGSGLELTVPTSALGGGGALEKAGTALATSSGQRFCIGDSVSVRATGVDSSTGRVILEAKPVV